MKNLVKLIEIPATDFIRAVKFYETVLGIKLTVCDSCETEKMAFFSDFTETEPNVAISWAADFLPSKNGVLVSLKVDSMEQTLERIHANGGKLSVLKQKSKRIVWDTLHSSLIAKGIQSVYTLTNKRNNKGAIRLSGQSLSL